MKKYQKAEIIAKNLTSGSYAAGCPSLNRGNNNGSRTYSCLNCERTQ